MNDGDAETTIDERFARGGLVPPSRSLPLQAEGALHVCLESLGQVLDSRLHRYSWPLSFFERNTEFVPCELTLAAGGHAAA